MNWAPMTRRRWSKWSERAGGVNQSSACGAAGPKQPTQVFYPPHEKCWPRPCKWWSCCRGWPWSPPCCLSETQRAVMQGVRKGKVCLDSLSKVNTAVSTCTILKVTQTCKLNYSETRFERVRMTSKRQRCFHCISLQLYGDASVQSGGQLESCRQRQQTADILLVRVLQSISGNNVPFVWHCYFQSCHQWLQASQIKFPPWGKYFITIIKVSVALKPQVYPSFIPKQSASTCFSKLWTCSAEAAHKHNQCGFVGSNIHQCHDRWFYSMSRLWRLIDWLNWGNSLAAFLVLPVHNMNVVSFVCFILTHGLCMDVLMHQREPSHSQHQRGSLKNCWASFFHRW